jgi:hypothetical protein
MGEVAEVEDRGTQGTSRVWSPVEQENRWPHCLVMQLEPGTASPDTLELRLTINFNEQHLPLLRGRVTYGLAGGDLSLSLSGGKIPYALREPKNPLAIQLAADRTVTSTLREGSKGTRSAGVDLEVAESKGKGVAKLQSQAEIQQGTERQLADKFPHVVSQITTKGLEEQPIWSFELKSGDPVLKGSLDQFMLGILRLSGGACRIHATFETLRRHIRITGGDGIWPDDLGQNKRAIIDAAIRKFLASKLAPYLSRMQIRYE